MGLHFSRARPHFMYSISHPNPSIGEELSSAQAMSDGRRAGFGRTSAAIVPIAVVVRAVFQVGVIVKPMAMSMNLIMVIGVIAVLPYLTIGFSRRCSELVPTSRRAVQLDLGYRFLLPHTRHAPQGLVFLRCICRPVPRSLPASPCRRVEA
jgi:hypothetical protein